MTSPRPTPLVRECGDQRDHAVQHGPVSWQGQAEDDRAVTEMFGARVRTEHLGQRVRSAGPSPLVLPGVYR